MFIGVPGRDDVGPMREFVAEHGLGAMPHAVDEDGTLWAKYGVSYQPAWVFVNQDGAVTVHPGALAGEQLDAVLSDLTER